MIVLYDKNSHTVTVSELKDTSTGLYINSNATVQLTKLVDAYGADVIAVAPFPVALAAVVGTTTGQWRASIAALAGLTVGKKYGVVLEVNPSGEPRAYAIVELLVQERRL